MVFKDIGIEDRELYLPFLYNNPYGICEYSFTNMFCWQEVYSTQGAIVDGFLIIRCVSPSSGTRRYLMPLGDGARSASDKRRLIADMNDFAKSEGDAFVFCSLTKKMEEELEEIMPGMFVFSNPNENCDYIYLSEDLRLLEGKKYSAKRNHISKFMRLYGTEYVFKPIDKDDINECHRLNNNWCVAVGCRKNETDYCAVKKALNCFEQLKLSGGVLYVNGNMAAFTLGQPINKDTFDIIAEKADKEYEGAYPLINREFARMSCAEYKYINREEDLGIDSLKKAKMSYHPYAVRYKGLGELK